MNSMLFPGINNELERIFDDKTFLSAESIYQSDELMERMVDLYTVMYKCGLRMSSDRNGYRVDRTSTAQMMIQQGKTVSNFSTSSTGYKEFPKSDITLVHAIIEKGTPCADFKAILGDDGYELKSESELLVAPFCPIEVLEERLPETKTEKSIKNFTAGLASKVYKIKVSPPEKVTHFNDEEIEEYEKQRVIFEDDIKREKSASFISKLMYLRRDGFSKEECLYIMDQKDLNEYLEWKNAFQSVYKYNIRQRILEIDRQVEIAKKEGMPLYMDEAKVKRTMHETGNTSINSIETILKIIELGEIDEMAEKRDLDKHSASIKDIQAYIDELLNRSNDIEKNEDKTNDR